jgi:hypothetical protein
MLESTSRFYIVTSAWCLKSQLTEHEYMNILEGFILHKYAPFLNCVHQAVPGSVRLLVADQHDRIFIIFAICESGQVPAVLMK